MCPGDWRQDLVGGGWGGAEWPIQPPVELTVGVLLAAVDPWPVQGAQAHGAGGTWWQGHVFPGVRVQRLPGIPGL